MNIKEKVTFIREIAAKNNITAYDIGKNTEISLTSARNVLEDDSISPRNKTLNIILTYLENAIVGTKGQIELKPEYQSKVAEEPATYNTDFSSLKIDDKLNIIYAQNAELQKNIEIISNALGSMLISKEEEINKKAKQSL